MSSRLQKLALSLHVLFADEVVVNDWLVETKISVYTKRANSLTEKKTFSIRGVFHKTACQIVFAITIFFYILKRLSTSNVTLHVDRFDCCARFSYARYAALDLTTCWYIALFSLLKHGGF